MTLLIKIQLRRNQPPELAPDNQADLAWCTAQKWPLTYAEQTLNVDPAQSVLRRYGDSRQERCDAQVQVKECEVQRRGSLTIWEWLLMYLHRSAMTPPS